MYIDCIRHFLEHTVWEEVMHEIVLSDDAAVPCLRHDWFR